MLVIAVLAFAILAVTTFCLKDKRFHLFETLAVWFSVTAVNAPIYSFFLVNRHWISVPDSKEIAVVRIVYTLVLYPLFVTWTLDSVQALKRTGARMACYAAALAVAFAGGWSLDKIGVVHFRSIGIWMYVPIKSLTLAGALGSVSLVRYLMRKDGISYDPISHN